MVGKAKNREQVCLLEVAQPRHTAERPSARRGWVKDLSSWSMVPQVHLYNEHAIALFSSAWNVILLTRSAILVQSRLVERVSI